MKIEPAQSVYQLERIRSLFREYETLLGVDLSFQDFEVELATLPGRYALPEGALLLATVGGKAAGCVAMRKQAPDVCEMKRLYVRQAFLKQGVGKELALTVIRKARGAGYGKMVLDTLEPLKSAMGLYTYLGFRRRSAYYDNPLPGVIYWELDLKG